MKRIIQFSSIFLIAISTLSFAQYNCFSIVAGKKATTDGSVFFAHNEDDSGEQLVNYYKVPRMSHDPGETITLSTGAVIPQAPLTWSYLWLEMPGMHFSDSYINEWGVTISSDACRSREDNPQLTDGGIKYWLRRLVAERARTAREGVKIAGSFIEKLGYASSGRTYVIADREEGWLLAAVNGTHWVAQRVPDDQVAVLPNYYTIGEIDLADTSNFLGSRDIIDYSIQQGWYDPEQDGDFHFARVYSRESTLKSPVNIHRMWRGINLLSEKKYRLDDSFPFSFVPAEKVTLTDLFRVLRDHYEGTELDLTNDYDLGSPHVLINHPICDETTQYGFVAQLRSWMPAEIGCVLWLAQRRPDCQPFIPWYSGVSRTPENYAYGDYQIALNLHFNPPDYYYERSGEHAFWTFVSLAEEVDENYKELLPKIRLKLEPIEHAALQNQQKFEVKLQEVYEADKGGAIQMFTEYTVGYAENVLKTARQLLK